MKYLLALLLSILFVCTGCTSPENETEPEPAAVPEMLTGLFTPSPITIPDNYSCLIEFEPEYNPLSKTVTFCGVQYTAVPDETGAETYHFSYSLFTCDQEGNLTDRFDLPVPVNTKITTGLFTEESIWFFSIVYEETAAVYLNRMNRTSGELTEQKAVRELPEIGSNITPQDFCTDPQGNLYFLIDRQILIYSENLEFITRIKTQNNISSLTCLENDSVYAGIYQDGEQGIARIDSTG